jgi:AcrR family transcriptional regulator
VPPASALYGDASIEEDRLATRDPEATKQRILDAALREFSDKGIAGARVDAIASRAGVSKQMLYYHFGSKDGLYREVLHRRLDEINAGHGHAMHEQGSMSVRQRQMVDDADYVRLLAWEALEIGADPLVDEEDRRALVRGGVEAVAAAQRAGRIPADLDAAQLVLSELLLVLGPIAFPQLTRLVTGHEPTSREHLEQRGRFLDALERHLLQSAPDRSDA